MTQAIWKSNIIRNFKSGVSINNLAFTFRRNLNTNSSNERRDKIEEIIRLWMIDRRRAVRP